MFSRALPIWKICCSTLLKIVHPLRFSDRMSGGQRPPLHDKIEFKNPWG